MIICEVYYIIKPDKVDELLNIVKNNVYESRNERGNISYTHYLSMERGNEIFAFEAWEDIQSLNAHAQSKHYREFARRRMPLLEEGTYRTNIYKAEFIGQDKPESYTGEWK